MTIKNALTILRILDLDPNEHVVMGTSALARYGLLPWESVKDLEMVAVGNAWEKMKRYGLDHFGSVSGDRGIILFEDFGKVYRRWVGSYRSRISTVGLINQGTYLYGVNFASPADIINSKLELSRDKDIIDIAEVMEYLNDSQKVFNNKLLKHNDFAAIRNTINRFDWKS